jgi:hypothetical protein
MVVKDEPRKGGTGKRIWAGDDYVYLCRMQGPLVLAHGV